MNASLWVWLSKHRWGGWGPRFARIGRGGVSLLEISTPESDQLLRRMAKMERDIFLPVKAAGILMLLYSFYRGAWIRNRMDVFFMDDLSLAVEWTRYFLWYYIPVNIFIAGVLLAIRRLPLGLVQWTVFFSGLMDAVFLSALTVLTSGYQSFLYWLFPALIIRSAVSVPRATSQLALHGTIIFCYVMAGSIDLEIASNVEEYVYQPSKVTQPSRVTRRSSRRVPASPDNRPISAFPPSPGSSGSLPGSNPMSGVRLEAATNNNQAEAVQTRPAERDGHDRPRISVPGEVGASNFSATGAGGVKVLGTSEQILAGSGARNQSRAETNRPSSLRAKVSAGPVKDRMLDDFLPENRWQTGPLAGQAEPFLVQVTLLILMSVCSYGVQVLFERQRKAEEEAREFAMREGQLQAAGRLAAEFTHQMKNPLAIINNAAFSLQRALKQGRTDVGEQIEIIQEEVEHSDRIITQIMGYAQLSEGRVEKLDVIEELNTAIERVFPPAAGYPVKVHRDYADEFPPLLMLRRHVSETLINLLQNAREALGSQGGNVWVSARCRSDFSIRCVHR